jgi:predicted RNase H-like HicB family nuclease
MSKQEPTITLTENEDGWWTARNVEVGVSSQGETKQEALENLDEAVALYKGEIGDPIETWEEEKEVLKDLGIDTDEVKKSREENDELPEFMR